MGIIGGTSVADYANTETGGAISAVASVTSSLSAGQGALAKHGLVIVVEAQDAAV